ARLKSVSQSSTYTHSPTGEPPNAFGPLPPIIASCIIRREFPTSISACMILPSGPMLRDSSSAPSPSLYHSIAAAQSSYVSIGVMVVYPSGTGFLAAAIAPSYVCVLRFQAFGILRQSPPRRRDETQGSKPQFVGKWDGP